MTKEHTLVFLGVPVVSSADSGAIGRVVFFLQAGGPIIVILSVVSVFALAIVSLKLYQFTVLRVRSRKFIEEALACWRAGRGREALRLLSRSRNPIARVLEAAVRECRREPFEAARAREEVVRVGAAQLKSLRSYLKGLEVIGHLSPLLGLFGTVLGMIEAFRRLEEAGARVNPAILSGGIWEALLTTAAGLAVAIPAVAVLNWLESAIESLANDMEDAATRIFTSMPHVAQEQGNLEEASLQQETGV